MATDNDHWYKNGLRFECVPGCGQCCSGAPGYVWVSEAEIRALATQVAMDIAEFEAKHVRRVRGRKSLIEHPNGDCVFYDNRARKCRVYEARPAQCRTWPFWESNLRSPKAWRDTCLSCPGAGRGEILSFEEIEAHVAVLRI